MFRTSQLNRALFNSLKKAPNKPLFDSSFQNCRSYATYNRFNNARAGFDFSRILSNRNLLYTGAGLVGFYLYNLEEAPFTKRLRCIWIPYWLEKKIGDYGYRQLLSEYKHQIVPYNDPIYNRIGKIMNRLLVSAIDNSDNEKQKEHIKSLDWKIHVIRVDPNTTPPNAFILPNGKIFVFSSILPICYNDDGFATVLSHELSHQLAHHSSEQMSKSPFYILLSTVLYSITGTSSINGILIDGILRKPASREMESEADHIGCELMARSCFDLQEAVRFWGRMHDWEVKTISSRGSSTGLLEFFSTHPNTQKRINDIQSWMADLERVKEMSGCYDYQLFRDHQHNFFK